MAVQHEINEILETIRKELPRRTQRNYEDAVKRAMRHRDRGSRSIARGLLRSNPTLRREWNRQQEEEGALAIFMLVIGLIGGAALMYLFDPDRGARRRAAFQVEVRHFAENASEAVEETVERVREEVSKVTGDAEDKAEELGDDVKAATNNAVNSVRNTAAKASSEVEDRARQTRSSASKVTGSLEEQAERVVSAAQTPIHNVANETLKALVHAEVMRGVQKPGAVEIAAENGMVTLTGTIGANEVQGLIEKVQAVPGVTSVDNRLEVHDATPGMARPPSNPIS